MTNEQIKQNIKKVPPTVDIIAEMLVSIRCSENAMIALLESLYRIETQSKHQRPQIAAHRLRNALLNDWVKE